VFRFGYLNVSVPALGDRPTAIGIVELTAGEQVARFGGHPMALYLYNSLTSILSVLLSQPRAGRWTVAEAVARGDVPPVFYVELLSSIAASALVAWYITGRDSQGRRRWREPIPLVFVSVLLANGAISYSYTKNEIVSVSGVLYALTLTVAIRHVLMVRGRARLLVPLALGLLLFNVAWAMRAAGLQAVLLRAAFSARSEWASVLMPGEPSQWPTDGRTLALTKLLKEQAISTRGISAAELPRWAQRWWGEE
jgi:hypothetical protein